MRWNWRFRSEQKTERLRPIAGCCWSEFFACLLLPLICLYFNFCDGKEISLCSIVWWRIFVCCCCSIAQLRSPPVVRLVKSSHTCLPSLDICSSRDHRDKTQCLLCWSTAEKFSLDNEKIWNLIEKRTSLCWRANFIIVKLLMNWIIFFLWITATETYNRGAGVNARKFNDLLDFIQQLNSFTRPQQQSRRDHQKTWKQRRDFNENFSFFHEE